MAWWAAIPAAIQLASSLFGKKKDSGGTVTEERSNLPSSQQWLLDQLSQISSEGLSGFKAGEAYSGNLSAPMSDYENQGMDWLQKYLNQGTGDLYGAGKNEILNTLQGGYDPYTSPYYQAMRAGANTEMEKSLTDARRLAGARGTYMNDAALREEGDIRANTTNYLQQLLGDLALKERQNRLGVLPQAMEYEKYESGLPLEKATAATTVGALPRVLEQQDLERQYQEWLRKRQEPLGIAQAALGKSAPTSYQDYQMKGEGQSTFERIMGQLPQINKTAGDIWSILFPNKKYPLALS